MLLAVNGTLMRGLELNPNMLAAGAVFVRDGRIRRVADLFICRRFRRVAHADHDGHDEGGS